MKNCPTNVRFATEHDANAIAYIHVASWQAAYHGFIPDIFLDSLSIENRQRKWLYFLSQGEKILVIENEKEVIGFADIGISRDLDTDTKICGEIRAIYLHPKYWHKGLGTKLCDAVFIELKKMHYTEVIVWSLEGNIQARKFYESMGFSNTGKLKNTTLKACTLGLVPGEQSAEDIIICEVKYHKQL